MTEGQYLALLTGLAVTVGANIIVVLTGVLINNNRLGDVKDSLRAEIAQTRAEFRAEIVQTRAEFRAETAEVRATEAIHHSELLQKFADLDNRLTHIER